MRPLIDTNNAAAVAFWSVFVAWGAFEWVPMVRERSRRRGTATSSVHEHGSGLVLIASLYLGLIVGYVVGLSVTAAAMTPQVPWLVFGLTLIIVGIGLRFWAIRTLGESFTRQLMITEGQTIVSSGPYRIVRHPSYLGAFVSYLGFAIAVGNVVSIVVVLACSAFGFSRRIKVEERMLRGELGSGVYDTYASGRARMIPGIW